MPLAEPILADLNPTDPEYASRAVDRLLAAAAAARASDLHLQSTADGLDARLRIDGVLQRLAVIPKSVAPNVIGRLKVLAELLTYRTDMPQEGRIRRAGRTSESANQKTDGLGGPPTTRRKCELALFPRSSANEPSCGSSDAAANTSAWPNWDFTTI